MVVEKPNEMLIKLERSCHQARQAIIQEFVTDAVGKNLINRTLGHPTLRALLELELNGCTSYQSARMLVAEGLARAETFKARAQLLRGKQCEYLEISQLGHLTLFDEQEGLEDNKFLSLLRGAILGYACVDYGQGICLTRELFETSLELPDIEILKRAVLTGSGEVQFPELRSLKSLVDEKGRAQASHWWSSIDDVQRSGRIVDFVGE